MDMVLPFALSKQAEGLRVNAGSSFVAFHDYNEPD